MAEGSLPQFNVPTTPTAITDPTQLWTEFFGDPTETQFFLQDIRMRHAAILQMDGQNFLWLKRMLSGTACPFFDPNAATCRDPLNLQAACYNTGYVGGYHTPLEIKIALPSSNRQIISQEAGQMKIQNMRPWTLWTPVLTNRDMLVDTSTGERFEVLNVAETGPWRGLIVAQFFDARALQLGIDFGMNVTVPNANR